MKEGKNTEIIVPDFDGPQRKQRRNHIALEFAKAILSGPGDGVNLEWCFETAEKFMALEDK